jgi:hypothetical protein
MSIAPDDSDLFNATLGGVEKQFNHDFLLDAKGTND